MEYDVPSLFDSINARSIEPAQVGRNFILPTTQFRTVIQNNNTVLIGPRGSGKTTLLKMLKIPALFAWKHELRAELLATMNYTTVYAAAQRSVAALLRSSYLPPPYRHLVSIISRSMVATNLMFGFLDTIGEIQDQALREDAQLGKFYLHISEKRTIELAENLSAVWHLPLFGRSILAMRTHLAGRLNFISQAIELFQPDKGIILAKFIEENTFFTLHIENVIKGFIEIVNEVFNDRERRWCICFDEIEILDQVVQTELYGCLRSIDQRAILKIAASPFSKISTESFSSTRPGGGQDFIPLILSHALKKDAMRFSHHMFQALLYERNLKDVTADDVFGKSQLTDNLSATNLSPYMPPKGRNYRRLIELKKIDPTFSKYLNERNINLEEIWRASDDQRASEVRKFIQIVGLRLEYGRNNVLNKGHIEIRRFRSRKRLPDFYLGAEAMLTICEGNPRFLIGLLRPLIEKFSFDKRKIPLSVQSDQVSVTVARYLSLLSSMHIDTDQNDQGAGSLLRILDTIGDYFFKDALGGDFTPEPVTTFVVDGKTPRHVVDAIGVALNQGALVFIPSKREEYVLGDIYERRYRFSYLLATRYHLPLTFGSQKILSAIVSQAGNKKAVTYDDLFSRLDNGRN